MHETPKAYFESHLAEFLKNNPDKSKNIGAVVQFKITGANAGDWSVDLTQTPGVVAAGVHAAPKCTVIMADTDFMDVVNKKLNSQMAFMQGKLKVTGDIGLSLKLNALL